MKHHTTNRICWILTSVLGLAAAAAGIIRPTLYDAVASSEIMPGIFSQDIMSAAVCLTALLLVTTNRRANLKVQLVLSGLMVYLIYAYGIYVIEQLYNALYPLYMAIFGLSFYSIVVNVASLPLSDGTVRLPRWIRISSAVYLLLNAVMFYVLWGSQIAGHIQAAERIEYTFSVYILDLCLIMPAFVIVAIQLLRNKPLGMLAVPSLLIFGFVLLLPLVIGELIKPGRYGIAADTASLGLFGVLTLVFAVLALFSLARVDMQASRN